MANYKLISHAGSGKCLNIYGSGQASNHRNVCLWSDSGASEQQWSIASLSGGTKVLSVLNTAYGLNIWRGSDNMNNCDIYPVIGNAKDSAITVSSVISGVYCFKMTNYNLYLTAKGSANGSDVRWEAWTGSTNQQWEAVNVGGGTPPSGENYATYPCKYMRITQGYTNTSSHTNNITGASKDYPIDEGCSDGGRDYMYCPCDEMEIARIYGVGTSGDNTIWLKSTTKVDMPIGSDYLVMMVIHPEDDDLSNLRVGQRFIKGQQMFREGGDNGYPNHFHISVATGNSLIGNGWKENNKGAWVVATNGRALRIQEAFYLDTNFTKVVDTKGISFQKI